ncbi:MAG: hypothetical protein CL678_00425 [Bdellovibrionaceae bacterium]|nr:hypothetical protein [Pseudobdellovibrionaceae bacterium]|tara:strand:+ start:1137 stop:1439 length:303 start_codon:yes stop_codon:yes gene_type:complete
MKTYGNHWSARAAQAVAKCRKSKGIVRKTKAGTSLRRWARERWVDKRTGKPCGSGGAVQYCRPTKRVSSKTPAIVGQKKIKSQIRAKLAKGRAPPIKRRR